MRHELERPDVNNPFEYTMKMDESTLLLVMTAMNAQYGSTDYAISQHSECDKLSESGCKVRLKESGSYGSCFQELNDLHAQAGSIIKFLEEARFVREHREAKSLASFRALQEEARNITTTALRTLAPTGAYSVLELEGRGERVPAQRIPSDLEARTSRVELTDAQLAAAEEIAVGLRAQLSTNSDAQNTN